MYKELKPIISVIVPIYNVEEYVRKCIDSIVNQTYCDMEIILVDDGSIDCSGQICDEYRIKDERIKVIHKKNGGLVSSRKAGLQAATGYYATYVDGDDWIEPDMYEKLMDKIQDADIIVSGVIRDYGDHLICEQSKMPDGYYLKGDLEDKIYPCMIYTGIFYERGLQPNIYRALYKRKLLLKNQMPIPNDICAGEDAACFYPTILDAERVVVVSDCLYHYRIRKGSMMDISDGDDLWRLKILSRYLRSRFCKYEVQKENLFWQLDYMMLYFMMLKVFWLLQLDEGLFPYCGVRRGDRIVVYGTGRFGKSLVNYIKSKEQYSIIAWIDSGSKGKNIEDLESSEYDYIVIAVLLQDIADEIRKGLVSKGIPDERIKGIDLNEIEYAKERLKKIL